MMKNKGFTLIEVLIALAILAIALTALLQTTAQQISNSTRLKEKTVKHWIGMQAISAIQLGLIPVNPNQPITQSTKMIGQTFYWRAQLTQTPIKTMQQINITVSQNQAGPFSDLLIGYRHV